MNPDLISSILLDGLMAAIAATGFAVISNPPRRAIAVSAVLAAVGHAFRFYMLHSWTIDISSATFIAAFTIGMLGVMTAKLVKCPAEIFAFPSLLPMIPGVYAYKTILALMQFMQENQDSNLEILNQNQVCYQLHYGAVCSGVSAVAGRSKPHGTQSGKRKMPCLPCLKVNAPA